MTSTPTAKTRAAVVGVAAGVAGTAMGLVLVTNTASPASHTHLSQGDALDYTVDHLRARHDSAIGFWIERTIAEMLPNQKFSVNGSAPRKLSEGVVVGTITDASGGAGYTVVGDDADNGTVVAFDSAEAIWRVAELTITVDETLGGHDAGETTRVGIAFDGNVDREAILRGLEGQKVAIALDAQGLIQHDPELYSIAHSGALLGLVSEQGEISMPVLDSHQDEFLQGVDSVAELRAEAAKEKSVIKVNSRSGIPRIVE